MIDNCDTIEKITGFKPGELFECLEDGSITKLELYKTDKETNGCTYDEKTTNFHMLPDDSDDFKSISSEIIQKRKDIVSELKSIIGASTDVTISNDGSSGGIQKLSDKTDGKYDSQGNLFSFIEIHYKGNRYTMMFTSFFKKNGGINSYLKKIQFIQEPCDPGYPEETPDFSAVGYGRVYSNPNISFYDNSEDIANEFLKFAGYPIR